MVLQSLDCTENDYLALLALCLLYGLANNKGDFLIILLKPHSSDIQLNFCRICKKIIFVVLFHAIWNFVEGILHVLSQLFMQS